MQDYYSLHLTITPLESDAADLLMAFLAEVGYDSFIETENGIDAFIPVNDFNENSLKSILEDFPMKVKIEYHLEKIEGRDWNEEWEKNYYTPIVIGDKCVIHSSFHSNIPKADYDIVIDPKMAFGTGHHATTSNMIRLILEEELEGRHVIDMGTGTGILAILCAMRGATSIDAIEIDPFAAENAIENLEINKVKANIITGDAKALKNIGQADILLANINRNIILEDLKVYSENVKKNGKIFLSGFYKEDIDKIMEEADKLHLKLMEIKEENNWVALKLIKNL